MNKSSVKKLLLNILQYSQENTFWSLILNENTVLQPYNFIKKILQNRCFPVNIARYFPANIRLDEDVLKTS